MQNNDFFKPIAGTYTESNGYIVYASSFSYFLDYNTKQLQYYYEKDFLSGYAHIYVALKGDPIEKKILGISENYSRKYGRYGVYVDRINKKAIIYFNGSVIYSWVLENNQSVMHYLNESVKTNINPIVGSDIKYNKDTYPTLANEKPMNILKEITEPLSTEVFLSEGVNKIEGWNELHKYNDEVICLTDFFGDDVEVLVYEEEPDMENPLQLKFEANYSPIDEAGDNLELLVPEHLEEVQIEGMTAQPVYAVSKEMDKSILYNMSDPYIIGNGKAKISVSQDKLNWTNEILVKDISLDWIDSLPNKLFIKLSFENCKHCFVGYLSLFDWEMFADEPIVQNDITSVVQNFYSGAYDIPNHKIEASFNDGVNWVTVYENKINQIAASAIQTGKLRLRITGTKNQTLYPFSYSWTEK